MIVLGQEVLSDLEGELVELAAELAPEPEADSLLLEEPDSADDFSLLSAFL